MLVRKKTLPLMHVTINRTGNDLIRKKQEFHN
jgi:hypothetical protein